MMSRLAIAAALAAGLACEREAPARIPEGAVEWSLSASADESEVQVGEDLTLVLALEHPPGGSFVPPPEASFEPFTVIDLEEETPSPVETRLVYRLAAFRLPEELEIPSLEVRGRTEDGEIVALRTEPVPVRVVTSLTPDVTEIHDIKDPVALVVPRDGSILGWLLAALAAALAAYLLYRKLRTEPETARSFPPPPPADVEALAALERLEQKGLLERGDIEPFHAELAEIVKRYAGRRFEVAYLERTTDEILRELKARALPTRPRVDLRAILDACDLVKFARVVPAVEEARRSFGMARSFVEETRPGPTESLGETA